MEFVLQQIGQSFENCSSFFFFFCHRDRWEIQDYPIGVQQEKVDEEGKEEEQ